MSENMQWKDAIAEVLSGAKGAMHYSNIADEIISRKLRKDMGATPANTVARIISEDRKVGGSTSTFVKTERGYYMLRSKVDATSGPDDEEDQGSVAGTGVINAFGMYWRLRWSNNRPSARDPALPAHL